MPAGKFWKSFQNNINYKSLYRQFTELATAQSPPTGYTTITGIAVHVLFPANGKTQGTKQNDAKKNKPKRFRKCLNHSLAAMLNDMPNNHKTPFNLN